MVHLMRVVTLVLLGAAACASQPPATVDAPTISEPAQAASAAPSSTGTGSPPESVAGADGPAGRTADPRAANSAAASSADDADASITRALEALGGVRIDAGIMFGSGSLRSSGPGTVGLGGAGGYGLGPGGGGSMALTDAGTIAYSDAGTGLSPEQIRRVVMSHIGALRACYEIEAQKNDKLAGKIVVTWSIDSSGGVSNAAVAMTTLLNTRVEGCVVRQIRSWRFPSSSLPSSVSYPFIFGVAKTP